MLEPLKDEEDVQEQLLDPRTNLEHLKVPSMDECFLFDLRFQL
jgi:hypothetical protein